MKDGFVMRQPIPVFGDAVKVLTQRFSIAARSANVWKGLA